MKPHTAYLTINHPEKTGFVHLTPQVEAAVTKRGVKEGLVLVNAMHISASVFINDDESGLHHDYDVWLGTGLIKPWIAWGRHTGVGNYLYLDGHAVSLK